MRCPAHGLLLGHSWLGHSWLKHALLRHALLRSYGAWRHLTVWHTLPCSHHASLGLGLGLSLCLRMVGLGLGLRLSLSLVVRVGLRLHHTLLAGVLHLHVGPLSLLLEVHMVQHPLLLL